MHKAPVGAKHIVFPLGSFTLRKVPGYTQCAGCRKGARGQESYAIRGPKGRRLRAEWPQIEDKRADNRSEVGFVEGTAQRFFCILRSQTARLKVPQMRTRFWDPDLYPVSQIQKPLNVAAKGVTPTSLGAEIRRVINCSTGVNSPDLTCTLVYHPMLTVWQCLQRFDTIPICNRQTGGQMPVTVAILWWNYWSQVNVQTKQWHLQKARSKQTRKSQRHLLHQTCFVWHQNWHNIVNQHSTKLWLLTPHETA